MPCYFCFSSVQFRNITPHSKKNLAFHSLLRRNMIIPLILTTSFIHFSLKGWENVLVELGSERVNPGACVIVRDVFVGGPSFPTLFAAAIFEGRIRICEVKVRQTPIQFSQSNTFS